MATSGTAENPGKFLDFINKIMSDPDIGPLIDITKLVRLRRYEAALDAAIQHYKQYGDHTFIPRLVMPLKQSIYFTPVLSFVCARASLTFSIVDGEIKLKKTESSHGANAPTQTLEQYLNALQEVARDVIPPQKKPTKKTTESADSKWKIDEKKPSFDMLDSRARLPGSFGSGKRR